MEVAVFVPLAGVAEAFATLVIPGGTVAVAMLPSLPVTSDTTTIVVDVLSAVSLDDKGRVGKSVVDKMVEVFAGINVSEETIVVEVLDGHILVVLKLKFPVPPSHMVRLVRDAIAASYAITGFVRARDGLPANVEVGAGVLSFLITAAVPI